ncbi:rhomboid family intramembrane serine protease [Candidatus Bathyarchaeota archaeon]|nr:rhomboid family intramembrane serine protease [Candidatus Bathyarchaeota archaeon]
MFPLYDENRGGKTPYINWLLIVLNVLVFFWQLQQGLSPAILMKYGAVPSVILHGRDLYTLVTSMFLHGGIIHLLSNMYFLFIFGDNVESAFGHLKYFLLYMIFGVVGGLMHSYVTYFYDPRSASIPAIGASGAISGVLGAYMVLFPRARVICLCFYFFIRLIPIPAIVFIGFWFLLQLLMSGSHTGVAYWAHIGGFLAGMIVALMFRAYRALKKPKRYGYPLEYYY